MKARLIVILTLVFGGPAAYADTPADNAGHRLVDDFITDVATFSGRFEQSLIDATGDIIEVTSGTLEIQRPGKFRCSYGST